MAKKDKKEQKYTLIENAEKGVTSPKIETSNAEDVYSHAVQNAAKIVNARLNPPKDYVNSKPDIPSPAPLMSRREEAEKRQAEKIKHLDRVNPNTSIASPASLMSRREEAERRQAEKIRHLDKVQTGTTLASPAPLMSEEELQAKRTEPIRNAADAIEAIKTKMPTNATVQNEKGLSPNAGVVNSTVPEKPKTIADLIAEGHKKAEKEKTDAQKMQRYHALTDVFNALGKMGGSVVGGAIGGDALVGTSTKEYQPNRGYLDAIEKAKTANDRIRALDDTAFQLQMNKQLRDEQWAREGKKIAEQREYEAKVRQIEMDFTTERDRLQREWAEADFEKRKELEKEMLALQQKYQKELYDIRYDNNGSGSGTGSGSGSKIKPITVNGKEYLIDMSNGVQISEIYNMIPANIWGGARPYGKVQYWDGEAIGRDNPTLDEMILAIGENKDNQDFITAFENRFGSGSNNGGSNTPIADELKAGAKK